MAILRRRQALPALRRNQAHERAVQTRMMLAAERALEATLPRVLAAAGRRAAQAARHGHDAVDAVTSLEAELGRVLTPAVAATARQFGARVIQAPKGFGLGLETKAFADLDAAIREHTGSTTARRVVQISDSLRETIRRTVERAIAENLGEEETAEAIVEATSGEIAMARARRIARTEIHNAAMYGQQAAAEASPLQFEKVWLATEDKRTRESHAKANGQRVALNDHFVLEDEDGRTYHLAYPGDARAPASQVINCRCTCLFEPVIGGATISEQPPIEVVEHPDRPIDIVLDEPAEEPIVEDVPLERDLEARPYEREATVLYASGDGLNLSIDGTPRVGQTVRLIGPNDLYHSPDTPEVDRAVARQASGVLLQPSTWFRRPQLWRIVVPAGPLLPEGLFAPGGHGVTVTSGVGRYGLVTLTVESVTNTTWGDAAPKPLIWIDDYRVRATIEGALGNLETISARETVEFVLSSLEGQRLLDADRGEELRTVPLSVMRTLNANHWNKRSLRRYLENLLEGFLQDTPEVGEPATDTRVIVVEATMNIADALGDRTEE